VKEDQFGRDIRLSNGNVTSRILPIKIHDLDAEDVSIVENEISGVLRPIEFIFRSPGVNRPLRAHEEHPQANDNKSFYRDQINKVANAIKQIVYTIKKPEQATLKHSATSNQSRLNSRAKVPLKWRTVGIALAACIGLYWMLRPSSNSIEEKSIVVLPFQNLSGEAEQDYLGAGISEELLHKLSKIQGLKVIGRTSSFTLKEANEDYQAVLEQLDVAFVLEGSVRKEDNSVRISAQLIRTADNLQIWSETYDRKMEGIFKLQDDIASAVVDALKVRLSSNERNEITKKATRNPKAYELYLRAVFEFQKYSPEGNRNALRLFSEALAIDSTYAHAYTGTAQALMATAAIFGSEREALDALELAKPYVDKALALDENSSNAHWFLGFYYLYHNWDFDKSELEYKKSLQIDPNHPDALSVYADYLNFVLRHDEALSLSEQQLESDFHFFNPRKGLSLFYLNRFQEALEFQSARLQTINTYFTYDTYGFVCLNTARYEEAINSFNKAIAIIEKRTPRMIGWMGAAYAKQGKIDRATELLNELIEMRKTTNAGSVNFFIAVVYSAMGKEDEAIRWLERAYVDHDMEMPWLISEPQFYNLHKNTKFVELARKIGFPNSSLAKLKDTATKP
jgi:serine/threonine-protein kinase